MEKEKHKVEDDFRVWSWKRALLVTGGSVLYGILMLMFFSRSRLWGPGVETGPAYVTFLALVPAAIGVMSVYALPPARRTTRNVISVAIVTTLAFMGVAVLSASGIFLCVLMIAPFCLVTAVIGALLIRFVERWLNDEKSKRQYAFGGLALLLPFLLAPVEAKVAPPDWYRTVEDSLIIRSTPEQVWNHIIRMDDILPEEQRPSFYHTMGIPRPVRAVLTGEGVGAVRQGEFEYDLTFREKIIVWQPFEAVRFSVDIHVNNHATPVLEQIGGRYFDILEAGYRIEALEDGTVRLYLDSQYRLSTNFNFYGAFWSDWIMHDFQAYVVHTVKQRVESGS